MTGRDLFDLFRQLLALLGGVYVVVRLVNFVVRWQVSMRSTRRAEALARRYLVLQALRVRISRFVVELLQIAALVVVLAWLIHLH
jgi:hypothetical protein